MIDETITKPPMQILSCRVPVYIHRRVHTIATEQERTVSDYMRQMLSNKFKEQKV